MHNPVATYRLQFHKDFNFSDFEDILWYVKRLGVSTIYASPIFTSSPGSTHGYDGLNPHQINPEVGSLEQFTKISTELHKNGIGWLQDIVPNHMAFHPGNPWLMDVLEKGQRSEYASFFDVSWTGKIFHGRMMVPFLGAPLTEVIQNKELKITYTDSKFMFSYFDTNYPLNLATYKYILDECTTGSEAVKALVDQLTHLRRTEDAKTYSLEWNEFLLQLSSLMKNEAIQQSVNDRINSINNNVESLTTVADQQDYQLSYWQRTDTRINFRRFFTVNGLIALNIHDPEVLEHHHLFIKQLVHDGLIQGLRIDHIDGLYDPTQYLHDLRKLAGSNTYIVVEKILEPGEEMLKEWPIQGNSGYDFLSIVNNLFTQTKNEEQFTNWYQKLVGDDTPVHQQIREKKALILTEHMQGELDNLVGLFRRLNLAGEVDIDALGNEQLSLAIGEFLIECPVYRYYGNSFPLPEGEVASLREIFDTIRSNKPAISTAVTMLEDAFITKPATNDAEYNTNALRFYQRCMQFTGPLMAKGVEDTLMYTYNRFIAHNEVGDAPESFGITTEAYHSIMIDRQRDWPLSINATSTHDTKRGEDVRARLNVLSDLPDEWFSKVEEWRDMNVDLKTNGFPNENDEYFIYQTLVGVYAMPGQHEDDIINRLQAFLEKALREAKANSNWAEPNEAYETATKNFAVLLLDKQKPFFKSFQAFHEKIAAYGVVNSLVQVLLRFTSPGIPDTYQGTELWDLSLVDPDNRRPADYGLLKQWLNEIDVDGKKPEHFFEGLWADKFSGRIKLWLTNFLFQLRRSEPDVFSKGSYLPLKVTGAYKDYVIAFARQLKQKTIIIVAPLHLAELCQEQSMDLHMIDWKDTSIELPAGTVGPIADCFTGQPIPFSREISMQRVFGTLPFAVLQITQPEVKERSAGVLMHITSLDSPFGIGDVGPGAKKFADFLHKGHQRYWQILPINPTENGQSHSPYSSICSMAGNTLLISPESLFEAGLLTREEVLASVIDNRAEVMYDEVEKAKGLLFDKAWLRFYKAAHSPLHQAFDRFCLSEKEWLDDFALYTTLKNMHNGQAWYQWPAAYRLRQREALDEVLNERGEELQKTKWLQFVFMQQWTELKVYCNKLHIQLFGDLPFYASYDSVDVWSNPQYFSLDENGNPLQVAGVPPDFFSADGQLWGMPVFNWEALKTDNYKWWINRLRKNIELFDLVRLDHFRAFAAFWQVPANEKTARNGEWQPGPGDHFFREVKNQLGDLPFVAEDLGDINEPVYELRDEFKMPGMKVLQFAFGDGMPQSNYLPQNYTENFLVYTGTHDNNTTRGWHRKDATGVEKENLNQYAGRVINSDVVHDVLNRMAYSSVAKIAILPMQDLLGLDETARMNKPSTSKHNWAWRLPDGQITPHIEQYLALLARVYNR